MKILNKGELKSLITALALGASVSVSAFADNTQRCFKDEYILTVRNIPAIRSQALTEIDSTTPLTLEINQSSKETILVSPRNRAVKRVAIDKGSQIDLCKRLASKRRKDIKSSRKSGRERIVRQFSCSCNEEIKISATPNDTYYSLLWGMHQSSDIDINAPQSWDFTTGDTETTVAIIDTGIDYTHPDLQSNIWVNTREVAGNGIDDDQNGYVDDINGINTINGSGNPFDDNGHGTHVAGTIGAQGNNGVGVVGVNWRVKMIGVKFLSSSGSGSLYDAIEGVDYVTNLKKRGEKIVLSNNSWGGGGYTQPLYDAIARARDAGLLFVAAAGNDNNNNDANPSYPASYQVSNVISVASIENTGQRSSFSNYGATSVHIAAPGSTIASTYPGNRYVYLSGTSMAAPHVSGALSLVASYAPALTASELKSRLLSTARVLPALTGVVSTGALLNLQGILSGIPENIRFPVTPTPTLSPTPTRTPTPTPTMTPTPTIAPGYYQVSGRLVANGKALSNAKITLVSGGSEFVVYSGENGEFSFYNIFGPATYTVTVQASGHTFTVNSGQITGNLNLNLTGSVNNFNLSVVTLDNTGNALPGVTISGPFGTTVSDSNGRASFVAPFGSSYRLTLSKSGSIFSEEMTGIVLGNVERVAVSR